MADLFDTSKQNISLHLNNLFAEGEIEQDSVVKESLITAADGKSYSTFEYHLDAVLAVGFRVRSPRGVQFRRWANSVLKEYLIKGFAMDDERLKDPKHDYFDELLERIRDIRASEAVYYRKLRDILSLSEDYDSKSPVARDFYATIQNKMLYGITGHTAAELISERSNPTAPNMGLTSWKHGRVRKEDVTVAKNYLGQKEIRELNLIVTMFLDTADFRAERRQTIRLAEWDSILDDFLKSNELNITARKKAERLKADSEPDIDVSVALGEVEKRTRLTRRTRKAKE